jgi:transmembrane sensor
MEKNSHHIEQIITKFLEGTFSDIESELFTKWLKESRENRESYFAYKNIWLEAKTPEDQDFVDHSWSRLRLRTILQENDRHALTTGWRDYLVRFSIAASILVLIGISLYFGSETRRLSCVEQMVHEIHVPLGSRTSITLPDGTHVWLNAGSSLTYNAGFGRRNRDVSLVGEAYFDVREQKSIPMMVQTRDLNIRVMGTKFNVKSYPEENKTETTLVSGQIEVLMSSGGDPTRTIMLARNQRLIYTHDKNSVVFENATKSEHADVMTEEDKAPERLAVRPGIVLSNVRNTHEYVSWKDGKLVFRSEPLKTLVPKLERFYNVNIYFKDASIQEHLYSGTLKDVTIEEVLRGISVTSGIRFEIEKNQITLSK